MPIHGILKIMKLTYDGASTDGNNYSGHRLLYSGNYFYAQEPFGDTHIFNSSLALIDTYTDAQVDSNLWTNDYFAYSLRNDTYNLAYFNGTTANLTLSYSGTAGAYGIALNGSYVYFWVDGYLRVYNYAGAQVNSVETDFAPKWLEVSGSVLWAISSDNGYGAYLRAYTLSGSNVTLAASYELSATGLDYVYNNVGYPYFDPSENRVYIGINSQIYVFDFTGSALTLYKVFKSPRGVIGACMGSWGDYLFFKSSTDYTGTGPFYLSIINKKNYKEYAAVTRSTGVDLGVAVVGNYCYITGDATHESIERYVISETANIGSLKSEWI